MRKRSLEFEIQFVDRRPIIAVTTIGARNTQLCRPDGCLACFCWHWSPGVRRIRSPRAPPTIEPAQAAESPPVSQNPAGSVRPLAGHAAAAVFDSGTHQLAVLTPGADPAAPASLARVRCTGRSRRGSSPCRGRRPRWPATAAARSTSPPVAATSWSICPPGTPRRSTSPGPGRPNSPRSRAAPTASWCWAAPTAPSTPLPEPRTAAARPSSNRNKIFARVDSLVTQGNTTVVLDRGQTSVTTIGANGHAEQALRAGEGATTMAADPLGRVLVADTRGGELLVYGVDPLILRQAYPVRARHTGWPAPGGWPGCPKPHPTPSLVTICQPEFPSRRCITQLCSNPTRWPLTKRRTPCTWCRGPVRGFRSSSTRRVPSERRRGVVRCRRAGTPMCPTNTSGCRCACRRK